MFLKFLTFPSIKGTIPGLGLIFLAGVTTVSTAAGASKIFNNSYDNKLFVTQDQIPPLPQETKGQERAVDLSVSKKQVNAPTPVQSGQKIGGTTYPQRGNAPPITDKCVIILFGGQYDVTKLRDTHSGGNTFVCGTDMTAQYQSKHGTNLSRMASYLVTPLGSPISLSPVASKPPSAKTKTLMEKEDKDDWEEIEREREEDE